MLEKYDPKSLVGNTENEPYKICFCDLKKPSELNFSRKNDNKFATTQNLLPFCMFGICRRNQFNHYINEILFLLEHAGNTKNEPYKICFCYLKKATELNFSRLVQNLEKRIERGSKIA